MEGAKPPQCQACKGSGLVRRAGPQQLPACKHGTGYVCYLCEGSLRLGNYTECHRCHGTGEAAAARPKTS